MISRETFLKAIENIKKHEELMDKLHEPLKELGDFPLSLDFEKYHREALMDVLKEAMADEGDYIGWWLYEAADYTVSWTENGKEVTRDLTDVNALYDFLVENVKNIPLEHLPIRDPQADQMTHIFPHKMIDELDFLTYFERVLDYVEVNDVVLQICEDGIAKYVLMRYDLYQQLEDEVETARAKQEAGDGSESRDD